MITDKKEYINRYDVGQRSVDNGNWRLAFDCFKDCKAFLERYESWNEKEINHIEELIEICNRMFK